VSISDDEISNAMEAWNLEPDGTKRTPYKRVKERKGESIPVACRADALVVRRLDEILASAKGWPDYKTRSDIIQDAIVLWLERWEDEHPDTATALSHQLHVEKMGRRRAARNEFYELAKHELDGLREEGDITGLYQFIEAIDLSLKDFRTDAPAVYLRKIDELRTNAKRMIDASDTI